MTTFQEHKFDKGFYLDEQRIHKIHEILVDKIATIAPPLLLIYKLGRADSSSYTTQNIQEIFQEENSKGNKITKLTITVGDSIRPQIYCNLYFHDDYFQPTYLEVRGEDKHLVNALFSELKQYLSKKVNIFKGLARWIEPLKLASPFLIPLIFVTIWLTFQTVYSPDKLYISSDKINAVLQSKDPNKKLDYLIYFLVQKQAYVDKRPINLLEYFLLFCLGSILVWFLNTGVDKLFNLIKYLFPRNVFYLGESKEEYEKIKELRKNLFWGIIVAFLVSILAGLPYFLLTK